MKQKCSLGQILWTGSFPLAARNQASFSVHSPAVQLQDWSFSRLLLEELDQDAVALHSHKSQSLRLASLQQFRSGRVRILLATDVASRDWIFQQLILLSTMMFQGIHRNMSIVWDILQGLAEGDSL
uniref:Helicase C-terminal domain-containing protein n=1 Tax=Ananas comosus var. bracteatus TaxID=296719 RepID=A0A6V7PHL4_ANACO|nr:unnamed protein product [Ananas comosus var. bracteatus]